MSLNKRKKLRQIAFHNQSCRCFYCQLPIWEGDSQQFISGHGIPTRLAKYLQSTAEHLLAQQDSGKDTPDNIVAACLWCNGRRHMGRHDRAPDPVSYKTRVEKLVSQGKWHPVVESGLGRI